MKLIEGSNWKAHFDDQRNLYTAWTSVPGAIKLFEIILCISDHPVRLDGRERLKALKYQCLCGSQGFGRGRKSKSGFSRKFTYFHVVRQKMAYKMAYRIKKMAYRQHSKNEGESAVMLTTYQWIQPSFFVPRNPL